METSDWQGRARREAAAILAGALPTIAAIPHYEQTLTLVAIGWLQGVNVGAHETLAQAEAAFERVRDEL